MGESGDSEPNYGLDALAKNAIYPNESRGDLEVPSQIVEHDSFWAIRAAFFLLTDLGSVSRTECLRVRFQMSS